MMWTRKELKQQAKAALRRNYWKIVLVALIALLFGGGIGGASSAGGNSDSGKREESVVNETEIDAEDIDIAGMNRENMDTEDIGKGNMDTVLVIYLSLLMVIFIIVFAGILVLNMFFFNPLWVGVNRFMIKSVADRAEVKEVAYGFDHSYKNIVKTLFYMDLQIFLWALLFIIPGIYKKYQYRMVPYILAEQPGMEYREAMQRSKDMMRGEKWNTFVLDLSFILWHMLGMITVGIAEIFYVQPYQQLTCAALYRRISGTADEKMRARAPERGEGYGI